jgi:hypothetical protein
MLASLVVSLVTPRVPLMKLVAPAVSRSGLLVSA